MKKLMAAVLTATVATGLLAGCSTQVQMSATCTTLLARDRRLESRK